MVGGPLDGQRIPFAVAQAVYSEGRVTGRDPDGTVHVVQHTYFRRAGYYLYEGLVPCLGEDA